MGTVICIYVLDGPDAGRSVSVGRPTLMVGTGQSAQLRLTDAAVEGEHLELSIHPSGIRLRDLGSSGGTWVGSLRVQEAVLTHSTLIVVGHTTLAVDIERKSVEPESARTRFGEAIAQSASMQEVFTELERAAREDIPVLIYGESGVGKDVLARAVHAHSARKPGPFVKVDCRAIAPMLLEGHLFAAFVQADGGTLFLDEIGELPVDLQPKLLRALEDREVRIGGEVRRFDVRVVAATNGDLHTSATFRRDLYDRLAVLPVNVPPLRERREDILPLAQTLLRRIPGQERSTLPPELEGRLVRYAWPGNVRELKNVIQRFVTLGAKAPDLFERESGRAPADDLAHLPYRAARALALERFERAYIPSVLAQSGNVVVQAAKRAGVERGSFHRMLGRIRDAAKTG